MIIYVKDKKIRICQWDGCNYNYEAKTNPHSYCKACLVKFKYKIRNTN